jgi:dTDP-glucose 4,6-dehydratase
MRALPKDDLDHVLSHAGPLLRAFSGGRIFITGGTGFIGKWLLESLLHSNRTLNTKITATVLSRDPDGFLSTWPHFRDPALNFRRGDVREPQDCSGHDAVIHASGDSDDKKNSADPLTMLDSIVQGGRNVLQAAMEARCRHVLILGSGAVYGDQPTDMTHIDEDCRLAPRLDTPNAKAIYGEGKRIVELLAAHYAERHELPVCTARCFSFLGPYLPLDRHFAAGNFIRDALLADEIVLSGDGGTVRSYMHPADLAIWLWTLLFRGTAGQSYNVGSDVAVTTWELAQKVAMFAPRKLAVRRLVEPGNSPPNRYVPGIAQAQALFGLDIQINLDHAIRRTLAWHSGASAHLQ